MLKLKENPKWEASKSIFWGLVFTVLMFAFWYGVAGSPLDEFRFMQQGVVINADVGACRQEYAESDSGQGGPYQECSYRFKVDGKSYGGVADFAQDVGETVEMVYLPEDPSIHRNKLGAASGIFDFVFRKIILGIVLLVMFVSPGINMTKNGIKEFYRIYYPPPPPPKPKPMSPEMIEALRKIDERMGYGKYKRE